MKKRTVSFMFLFIAVFAMSFSRGGKSNLVPPIPLPPEITNPENPNGDFVVPEIKEYGEDIDENELRYLEKTYTVMLEAKVNVFIPLEVVSDINIETTIVGNQIKEIPFEIELNRKPEKQNYYSVRYSESSFDIDNDGKIDTYIHSPKYINDKISKDNYVKIYGEQISKEGKHSKVVYVTVEAGS